MSFGCVWESWFLLSGDIFELQVWASGCVSILVSSNEDYSRLGLRDLLFIVIWHVHFLPYLVTCWFGELSPHHLVPGGLSITLSCPSHHPQGWANGSGCYCRKLMVIGPGIGMWPRQSQSESLLSYVKLGLLRTISPTKRCEHEGRVKP